MTVKYLTHAANYAAIYTVAASEASSVYPVANIYHPRLSKVWRSAGGLSNVDLMVDLGAPREVNIIGLANHNFSAGASIQVAAGTTAGVSDFSTTITYRAGSAYTTLANAQAFRYWRVRITDPANADGYLEAGYLLLGITASPPRGIAYDPGISIDHISNVDAMTSEFGSMFSDWINDQKRITFSFAALSQAQRVALLTWIQSLREETNPLFLIPHDTIYDGWYMRLVTTATERANQVYGSVGPLTFMEEGSGKRMAA